MLWNSMLQQITIRHLNIGPKIDNWYICSCFAAHQYCGLWLCWGNHAHYQGCTSRPWLFHHWCWSPLISMGRGSCSILLSSGRTACSYHSKQSRRGTNQNLRDTEEGNKSPGGTGQREGTPQMRLKAVALLFYKSGTREQQQTEHTKKRASTAAS